MNKNIKYSQNFLTSEKVLNQIIKQLNLKETDTVYEIGTGKGHLTTKLAKISKQVTSIELDSHLFNLSSEKLKLNTRVTLIHQDILQFQFPNKQRYKIVGSIPYHLSTQIIKKVVFESHASDIYLIVEEGFYKRTLDICCVSLSGAGLSFRYCSIRNSTLAFAVSSIGDMKQILIMAVDKSDFLTIRVVLICHLRFPPFSNSILNFVLPSSDTSIKTVASKVLPVLSDLQFLSFTLPEPSNFCAVAEVMLLPMLAK